MIEQQYKLHKKLGENSGASEKQVVPAQRVTPVMFLLNNTNII
jgi:hypothetical protein